MRLTKKRFSGRTICELREFLLHLNKPVSEKTLHVLELDPRAGVRHLARVLRKRNLANRKENQRLLILHRFEIELGAQGFHLIAGVDEAGMAPLAGPVIAAAVILPSRFKLRGLDDSKKIVDARKRQQLAVQIKKEAVCWSVARAEVEEIDAMNIYHSGLLAMRRAVEALSPSPEYILVDARTIPHCSYPQKAIIHGDSLSASIAAASIIAKTTRDELMLAMDRLYPGYGFAAHKGYPTAEHLRLLKELGPLPIHRRTFGPVREALSSLPVQGKLFS